MRVSTLLLLLLVVAVSACVEAPVGESRGSAAGHKPTPPIDAEITQRRSAAPPTQRGKPAKSPSTGEPVEVHQSR